MPTQVLAALFLAHLSVNVPMIAVRDAASALAVATCMGHLAPGWAFSAFGFSLAHQWLLLPSEPAVEALSVSPSISQINKFV